MAINSEKIHEAIVQMQVSGNESTFINELLHGALNWPIAEDYDEINIEDISYSWNDILDEMGFESNDAPVDLRQIRPFPGWPLGIFIIRFGSDKFFTTGRGMTLPLRKILRNLVQKLRPTSTHPSWKQEQLLFLCHNQTQYFQFAHFKRIEKSSKTSQLRMFGWGPNDQIRTICEHNLPGLVYDESISQSDVINNLDHSFDVRKVSKQFYLDYNTEFSSVEKHIQKSSSIADSKQIRQATQTLFNRLLFLRFIEKKGWLKFGDSDDYLKELYCEKGVKSKTFFSSRLRRLFFEGLAIEGKQKHDAYGEVPFLNGGLFEKTELDKQIIDLPDSLFEPLLSSNGLFYRYNFTVQESTPLDIDVAIDPEMIGTMFEELVTGKKGKGAFYTPRIVVSYMCREAIKSVIEEKTDVDKEIITNIVDFNDDKEISVQDARKINLALLDIKAIDPACGSGAYLLGLLHELIRIHSLLSTNLEDFKETNHEMKLRIISNSIYGSDIDPFATNIAMLRLWLSLSVEATEPTPLPNLDFNIETGDSLLSPDPSSYVFDVTGSIEKADALSLKKKKYMKATGSSALKLRQEIKVEESKIREQLRKKNNELSSVDFRVHFASIFTINKGFDIVLANPPYVRQEDLGNDDKSKLSKLYNLPRSSDLYCYFYIRASQLLRKNGISIFICSNSWLDVNFGIPLKKFLTEKNHLISVIDSSRERQFVSASVNTIISISRKVQNTNHNTNFVNLLGDFEESIYSKNMQTNRVVERKKLNPEEKWLLYTRAPKIYFDILNKSNFARLDSLGKITRGFTSGANDFFFLPKNSHSKIESNFLSPVIKTPKEVTQLVVNSDMLANEVFLCNLNKETLKRKYPKASKYITDGENKKIVIKRGKHKGTEIQGYNNLSTTKSRPQWYSLPKLKRSDILMRQFYNDKFDFPLNLEGFLCDHTFYYINIKENNLDKNLQSHRKRVLQLGSYLNSSISWFFVEILGRKNMGDGVLTCYGPEMSPFPVLEFNRLEGIEDLLNPLMQRPVESVFNELGIDPNEEIKGQVPSPKSDRKDLDDFIFDVIDLPNSRRNEFYVKLCEMVQNRLYKSKNIL